MKKTVLVAIATIALTSSLFAQNNTPIQVEKKGLGTVFSIAGQPLKPRQILNIMSANQEAYPVMKKAKANNDAATVLGFAGGFLVGYPLGTAIGGGDPNWALVGVGAGLIAIAIPLSSSYTKNAKKAVSIYNDSLKEASASDVRLDIGMTTYGLGLRMAF